MNFVLPNLCALSSLILLFAHLNTGACDSPDPENSVFHPIISYDIKVISDNSTISDFVSTFVKLVYASDTLKDLFDVGDAPSSAFRDHTYKGPASLEWSLSTALLPTPSRKDVKSDDGEIIADFATRPIVQNFETIPRDVVVRIYANTAANILYSNGKLSSTNDAEKLAKKYAKEFTENAKKYVKKGDYESKFDAIAQGIIKFVLGIEKLTQDLLWKVAFFYESQFLLAAVELGYTNDAYDQCAKEANESM
ncbi:uncharacterized protein NPIL_581241 [Nephila pilipes]|uniref:Uncharacterized protein n=1 Tax=Nephila pilipes TaxID=299642 RepID=A0A8X6N4C0_NEPPI|nr:uncharacterized protein NPIL_581241 [Nephila pilipes]